MTPFNGKERRFNEKKFLKILLIALVAITAVSFIVMGLWNAVLVPVLHVGMVNFWQALGILVLSKILFSGFKGRGGGWKGHHEFRENMREKWEKMTPEEREAFKSNWQSRCRGGWRRDWKNFEKNEEQTNAGAE